MNPLKTFILPVRGLKDGLHEYKFELDSTFFESVNPETDIDATLTVDLIFDKRPGMYILEFEVRGSLKADCDRCLEKINIPIDDAHQLYIKQGEAEDEADIVYLVAFEDHLDISKYVYDYAILSFPLMNVVECEEMENPPCNFEMLEKWDDQDSEDEKKNSIWEQLNNLNLDNKK